MKMKQKEGKSKEEKLLPAIFTRREKEILQLIASGKTSKEIAQILELSIETIGTHRKRMIKKINSNNLYEVLAYGFFTGVIKSEDIGLSFII